MAIAVSFLVAYITVLDNRRMPCKAMQTTKLDNSLTTYEYIIAVVDIYSSSSNNMQNHESYNRNDNDIIIPINDNKNPWLKWCLVFFSFNRALVCVLVYVWRRIMPNVAGRSHQIRWQCRQIHCIAYYITFFMPWILNNSNGDDAINTTNAILLLFPPFTHTLYFRISLFLCT